MASQLKAPPPNVQPPWARINSRSTCTLRQPRILCLPDDYNSIQSDTGDTEDHPRVLAEANVSDTALLTTSTSSPQKDPGGLAGLPAGSAVENATSRFALPTPPLAVRNLIEASQYAHLCTTMSRMHHRRAGYPFGMLIEFAADGAGSPVFGLSTLSIHSHNLRDDPRCSLVVQMPGWHGLSDARVTIFGEAYELPSEMQRQAKEIFLQHHTAPGKGHPVSDSMRFFRMKPIRDIYFVGGFGTMQWVDPAEYANTLPDSIVTFPARQTVDAITERFSKRLGQHFLGLNYSESSSKRESMPGAAVISIDAAGADVRVQREWDSVVHRLAFPHHVHTPEEALKAVKLVLEAS